MIFSQVVKTPLIMYKLKAMNVYRSMIRIVRFCDDSLSQFNLQTKIYGQLT